MLPPVDARRHSGIEWELAFPTLSAAIFLCGARVGTLSAGKVGQYPAGRVWLHLSTDRVRARLPWGARVRDPGRMPLCADVRAIGFGRRTERARRLAPPVCLSGNPLGRT